MISAVMKNKGNTLVLELPMGIGSIYEKMQSIGIQKSPKEIRLTDNGEEDVRVKLHAESDVGNHLIRVLNERNTVADASLLAFAVQEAKDDIKAELEQNLLHGRYASMQEIVEDIRQMRYASGPIKESFYCPLTGVVDEGDGDMYPVGNGYLEGYQRAIKEAIEQDFDSDGQDMAEFFHEDDNIKEKLASVVWSVESHRDRLFGKIECSLREELTDAETEILKEWISGQNADGWGEHFEQIPIDTEDGSLFVSFWHSGDDYSIMARDELDEYIENRHGQQMGGM